MATVYPYAVTIDDVERRDGTSKQHTVRVNAYNALDAVQQAILEIHTALNIAGESTEHLRVRRVEPDFTMVKRPLADPLLGAEIDIPKKR